MDRKRAENFASIPQKANWVLYVVFLGFLVIGARLWYLTVLQHESRILEARRTRRSVIMEPAMRGTIRDRFNIPLAANTVEYRVGILWSPIAEIPRTFQQQPLRKKYVHALAKRLEKELQLDAKRIEDVIYSYAVFSSHMPVILKSGLREDEYYRLNMLAREWPGLVVESAPKRIYPRQKSGCHVIGYTAALNRREFDKAVTEIRALKTYVEGVERGEDLDPPLGIGSFFEAKEKLILLERKTYGLNDDIGKIGIEAAFEPQLRGLAGKRIFVTNAHGDFLREVVGSRNPISGKRLVLTISTELQEWCEKLLTESEVDRSDRLSHDTDRIIKGAKNPTVRGGAIIAMDPSTAEVIACASYPLFDPNDFVKGPPTLLGQHRSDRSQRWIENDYYVKNVWDLAWPVHLAEDSEKEIWMTWEHFLATILPTASPLKQLLKNFTVGQLLDLQNILYKVSEQYDVDIHEVISQNPPCLDKWFSLLTSTKERCLLVDLSRLMVRHEELTTNPSLMKCLRPMSIDTFHYLIAVKVALSDALKKALEESFQKVPFQEWRAANETAFLRSKRKEEESLKASPKPFLHYIDKEKSRQFLIWWQENGKTILHSALFGSIDDHPRWVQEAVQLCAKRFSKNTPLLKQSKQSGPLFLLTNLMKQLDLKDRLQLLASLKGYDELTHPLFGQYSSSPRAGIPETGQGLIKTFLSLQSPPMASFCHMQPSAPGSMFKLVVAYAVLREQLASFHGDAAKLNPSFFTMIDRPFRHNDRYFVGVDSNGKPIPQMYKGGRLPRSSSSHIGLINLVSALGHSSNPYFSILANDYISSPSQLTVTATSLGYGQKTGISLPFESPGRFPNNLEKNSTGLYTAAIGQHTLLATPIQSAVMLSALATGNVEVPRLLRMAIGPEVMSQQKLSTHESHSHQDLLRTIGIDCPLYVAVAPDTYRHHIHVPAQTNKRTISITPKEQSLLFEGMKASLNHAIEDRSVKILFEHRKELLSTLAEMHPAMIGKSSTAESLERLGVGMGQKPYLYNHTWFGSIFFSTPHTFVSPNLVVVIFLRYGTFGKDAAPLAASVAAKWAEIQRKHAPKLQVQSATGLNPSTRRNEN